MAKKLYALDAEFKQAVQQVVRQFLNSWHPARPNVRRRRGGGAGSSSLNAIFSICSETIASGSGTTAEITPGAGKAKLYDTDPEDGVKTPTLIGGEEVEVDVRNYDPTESYAVGTVVYLTEADQYNGTQYYEAVSVSCTSFAAPE